MNEQVTVSDEISLDPERQRKAKEYARISRRLMLVDLGLGAVYALVWLLSGASAWLRDLILDEPTANLDSLTERGVMATVRALMAGRTTLIITHRLVGLEAVGEILVLRAGRIVERGPHHELWGMGGVYRRMWDLQRQSLQDMARLI